MTDHPGEQVPPAPARAWEIVRAYGEALALPAPRSGLWPSSRGRAGRVTRSADLFGSSGRHGMRCHSGPPVASVADGRGFRCRFGHTAAPEAGRGSGDRSILLPYDGPHRRQHSWHEVRHSYRGSGAEQHGIGAERRLQRPGHGVTDRYRDERQQVVIAAEAGQHLVRHELLDGCVPVVVEDHPTADPYNCGHRDDRHCLVGRQRQDPARPAAPT